jgi:hypothetical protein
MRSQLGNHAFGDIAVKIQGDDDPGAWPDKLAHECKDAPVGVLIVGRKHGAVIGDIDSVQSTCFRQTRSNCLKEPVHQRPIDGAVRVTPGQQNRHGGPKPGRIHRLHERRRLAHDQRIGSPRGI